MADPDIGTSLSDEEAEVLLPVPTPTAQRATTKNEGYKFNTDTNVKPDFNFINTASNSTSSSDPDEGFEILGTPDENEENDDNEGENSVPTTPVKLTPHKRAADAAAGGNTIGNGANGSPPSSPAPKKRKQFTDYLKEDDEKEKKKLEQSMEEEKVKSTCIFAKCKDGWIQYKYPIVAVIIAVVIAYVGVCTLTGNCPDTGLVNHTAAKPRYSWKKMGSNFLNWAKAMEKDFPMQNRETWIQLIASISETMKKTEPTHPAVITVLFPPTVSEDFALCFARKVGNIVNKAVAPYYNNITAKVREISTSSFSSSSITDFRSDIEEYFKTQGMAVITLDIDQFKSEENLIVIQGLCDSYHAVFKRATYLFPLQVPQHIFDKFDWIHERGGDIANDVLTEVWKNTLSPDAGPALVARVADSVIVLKEGDQCTL